ncbi:hypothetical protein D3C72_1625120 [compost metagenome]
MAVDEKALVDCTTASNRIRATAFVIEIDAVVGGAVDHVVGHDDAVDGDITDHRLHQDLVARIARHGLRYAVNSVCHRPRRRAVHV